MVQQQHGNETHTHYLQRKTRRKSRKSAGALSPEVEQRHARMKTAHAQKFQKDVARSSCELTLRRDGRPGFFLRTPLPARLLHAIGLAVGGGGAHRDDWPPQRAHHCLQVQICLVALSRQPRAVGRPRAAADRRLPHARLHVECNVHAPAPVQELARFRYRHGGGDKSILASGLRSAVRFWRAISFARSG